MEFDPGYIWCTGDIWSDVAGDGGSSQGKVDMQYANDERRNDEESPVQTA